MLFRSAASFAMAAAFRLHPLPYVYSMAEAVSHGNRVWDVGGEPNRAGRRQVARGSTFAVSAHRECFFSGRLAQPTPGAPIFSATSAMPENPRNRAPRRAKLLSAPARRTDKFALSRPFFSEAVESAVT